MDDQKTIRTDSVSPLESRVVNMLLVTQQNILRIRQKQDSLNRSGIAKEPVSQGKSRPDAVPYLDEESRKQHLKQQALLMVLTDIRRLPYLKEREARDRLKEIQSALEKLKADKTLKSYREQSLSGTTIQANSPMVYDQQLHHFCKINRNPEGSILANAFESFFEYTDPKWSAYFKGEEFLQVSARFIKTRKKEFLEFQFTLRAAKARQYYGSIDPSSPTRIAFMDGSFIYLNPFSISQPSIEAETGHTQYYIQYELEKEDLRHLKKHDVDEITMIWSSGSDRYDIIRTDLLKNLYECLQKKKLPN
ncbi:MAG TPA: hypothetical protein VFX48_04400 [Saprospiraceae bacterium]|nr:hypothetical protein [Saprospiraceae bacterium]